MENPLNNLLTNIVNHFIQSSNYEAIESYGQVSTLVRIHNEKLCQLGDVSFPCKTEIWQNYFPQPKYRLKEDAFQLYSDDKEKVEREKLRFLKEAKLWPFPVQHINIRQERCHLYLQRNSVIKYLIIQVMQNSQYGRLKKSTNRQVYLKKIVNNDMEHQNLAIYRSLLLNNVLEKLLKYSSWQVVENENCITNENACLKLHVLSVVSKCDENSHNTDIKIKCGLVTDPFNNGKMCQLSTPEYLSMRSTDMTLMALHKYGLRVKRDASFCAQMERLGTAAVTVDLLEVKHSSPVKIIRNGQGSTRGASFVLYNSARLESILRKFQERIDLGDYEPLPCIDNIQLELLKEEEEWQLVYVYIAGFPDLIHRCLEQIDRGLCSTHLIIRFLNGLAAVFSVYYRRIKILMEKRDHLMPYIYARICLIKAVREILNKTLALLDIEPVEFM